MFTSLDETRFHAAGDLRGHGGAGRLSGLTSIDGTALDENLTGTDADEIINGLAGDRGAKTLAGHAGQADMTIDLARNHTDFTQFVL